MIRERERERQRERETERARETESRKRGHHHEGGEEVFGHPLLQGNVREIEECEQDKWD